MKPIRHELPYEVPRVVWTWATDTFDDETCQDIWRIIFIRQFYRKKVRRTLFRSGALLGLLTVVTPAFFTSGSPALGLMAYALNFVLMAYLITGIVRLRQIAMDAVAIYASDWPKWLRIGESLDPLLRTVRRGDPMVSVLVTFEYPDAK